MSNEWADTIISQVNILDHIGRYEKIRQSGKNFIATHKHLNRQNSDCLSISPEQGLYHCFSCKEAGDVIEYEMNRMDADFVTACKSLAMTYGIKLSGIQKSTPEDDSRRNRQFIIQSIMNTATDFYYQRLLRNEEQMNYLRGRGVSEDTIKDLKLGFASGNKTELIDAMRKKNPDASKDDFLATGLFYEKSNRLYASFTNRIIFPYFLQGGNRTCYFVGRDTTGTLKSKYKKANCSAEYIEKRIVRHTLYMQNEIPGWQKWRTSKKPEEGEIPKRLEKPKRLKMLIAEGYLDAVLARQELPGFDVVLAPGTCRLSSNDIKSLSDVLLPHHRCEITVCFDTDENSAGQNGAYESALDLEYRLRMRYLERKPESEDEDKYLESRMPYIKIAVLPRDPETKSVDVADFVADGRTTELAYWLDSGRSIVQYEMYLKDNPRRFFNGIKKGFTAPSVGREILLEGHSLWSYTNQLHLYKNGVYVEGEADVEALVRRKLKDCASTTFVKECRADLLSFSRSDYEKSGNYINFQNCILDFEHWKPLEHTPKIKTLQQYPIEWDMNAGDAKFFNQWLSEIVHADNVLPIYEMIGSCFHSNSPAMQKGFLLYGQGSNGKSMLIKMIQDLLGMENICTTSWNDFGNDQWALAELVGKSAVIESDIPTDTSLNSVIKMLVSGDRLTAKRKFKDSFQFEPESTIIGGCNRLPITNDRTYGFWRRWNIIEFPNRFPHDVQKEAEIMNRFEAEKIQIVNTAIALYRHAYFKGKFTSPHNQQELLADYQEANDPVSTWISECLVESEGSMIARNEAFDSYLDWCESNNEKRISARRFYEILRSKGIRMSDNPVKTHERRTRVIFGYSLY